MPSSNAFVARSHFTTSALTPRQRFEAWEDSISVLFDVAPIDETLSTGFEAEVESFMIGSLMTSRCRSMVQAFERSNQTIARDGMDHILVQFYLTGGNIVRMGDESFKTESGDIQIIDMTRPLSTFTHATGPNGRAGRHFTNISLFIARDRLEPFVPSLDTWHLKILKAGTPLNHILRTYIMSMYKNAPAMTIQEAEMLAQPTAELLASTVMQSPEIAEHSQDTINAAMLLSIKKYIDSELHNPALSPAMIASRLGISRATLFRVCEPLGGIMAFIRTRRLHVARRLLCANAGKASVKALAYKLGFTNPSSFARTFKAHFGYTPTETHKLYMTTLKDRKQPRANAPSAIGDRNYEHWMMNFVS